MLALSNINARGDWRALAHIEVYSNEFFRLLKRENQFKCLLINLNENIL